MYNWKSASFRDRDRSFPQVITIFSAAKYSDSYNNKGAIIKFDVKINLKKNALDIQQFKSSTRPYNLPDFLNVFTWSMPFLAEKVTKMFYDLLSKTDADGINI